MVKEFVQGLCDQRATNFSIARLQQAAMDFAAAEDVELHGIEGLQIFVIEDVGHVFQAQHFPQVQTDEDIATLDAGALALLSGRMSVTNMPP